jgi:hypothetical protein
MKAFLTLTVAIVIFDGAVVVANAQQLSVQPSTVQDEMSRFQSKVHSFSVSVPSGWVIQDLSDADTNSLLTEMLHGYRILAQLCPQEQSFRGVGGEYNCNEARDLVSINRYPKLSEEPEFASIAKGSNNSIAANEYFLKYQIRQLQELGYTNVNIVNNTVKEINVTDTNTNKTIAEIPSNLVEVTYTKNSTGMRSYFLLTATNAISNMGIISGYGISYEGDAAKMPSSSVPQPVNQILQSFGFVKGESNGNLTKAANVTNGSSANSTSQLNERPPPIALPTAVLRYQANNTSPN